MPLQKKQKSHNTHTHIWMIYTRGKVAPECEKSQRCKWNARNELVKKHFSILILPVGWVVCCCRHRHRFWLAQFFFFPSWTRTNKVIYISFRILWCLVVFISFYTIFFGCLCSSYVQCSLPHLSFIVFFLHRWTFHLNHLRIYGCSKYELILFPQLCRSGELCYSSDVFIRTFHLLTSFGLIKNRWNKV